MKVSEVLMMAVIVIVFVIAMGNWLYGGDSGFNEVKDVTAKEIDKVIKDIDEATLIGEEQIKAGEIIPARHTKEIRAFGEAVEKIKNGEDNCFVQFSGFSPLGEKGTVITWDARGEEDSFSVAGFDGLRLDTDLNKEMNLVLRGMKPCVISGKDVPQNFFNNFLLKGTTLKNPYFSLVRNLKIKIGEENKIETDLGGPFDFEGDEWLFGLNSSRVCFFPTASTAFSNDGMLGSYFDKEFYASDSVPVGAFEKLKERKFLKIC
jgi:hypothetical protein